jgi:hypothetical protein
MGRQERTVRAGEKVLENGITVASSAKLGISNYGVTELPSTAAVEYVLDAPVEGVRKTIYSVTTTSAAVVVRMSTGTSVTVGNQGHTQITLAGTVAQSVDLLGVNSTQWIITGQYITPDTTALVVAAT